MIETHYDALDCVNLLGEVLKNLQNNCSMQFK